MMKSTICVRHFQPEPVEQAMEIAPPTDPPFSILDEPELCGECNSGARLANGLCLNCLLRGALDDTAVASETEAFKEALAAVKSRDEDWCIGNHEILDEIARGGMGVIYRAREPHSGRIVALKCVLAYQGDSDQALARFRREAETAARLDHPNIVPIYHVGETADGSPFFTMKYATNGSLLQARGPLRQEPRQSVLLMAKVAQAVQYAHERGVLHRDLKPGNILLDGRGEPLVSDFGLARCEEIASQLTRSLTSFGTPGYIAPEQADGPAAQLTPAADIYSLGAILFELLTGRPPFLGDNAFSVMKQSAEKPAPKLRTLAPHLDRDLETICARCLERDPSSRYRSAGHLGQDLENWLVGLPIAARPTGPWLRSRRWVRSNRRLAALLAAFLVVMGVSLAWQIRTRHLQSAMQESILASNSVVVVPFLDLDNVSVDPILTQSLTSSLQAELNIFGPARVKTMEPGSFLKGVWAQDLRQVGQQIGARTVLTGVVRTVQGRKRIAVRLLDASTGDPLFTSLSEENGEKNPVEATMQQICGRMYPILSAKDWSGIVQSKVDPGLRNDVAREAILAGRALIRSNMIPDFDNAIALFRKALRAEPDSALAHSYLAMTATSRTHYNTDLSFLELGKTEADKALLLAPGSGEAHEAKAGVCFQRGKLSEALEEQLRAIETAGLEERVVSFIGQTLDMLGRLDEALNWYALSSHRARMLGEVDTLVGDCWVKLGDDEQAVQAYKRAVEYRPDYCEGAFGIAHVRLLQGDFAGAREVLRSGPWNRNEPAETDQLAAQIDFFSRDFKAAEQLYRNLTENNADGGGSYYGAVTYNSAVGRARQALGDNKGAKALLEVCLKKEAAALDRAPENPEAAYRLAAVEASLDMPEAALGHLGRATTSGWTDYRSLNLDPRFDSLRGNPAFQTIVSDLSAKVADMRSKTRKATTN
jgi:serine/threonine protein kinase/tetratricopeptide (TPR) repeat protein